MGQPPDDPRRDIAKARRSIVSQSFEARRHRAWLRRADSQMFSTHVEAVEQVGHLRLDPDAEPATSCGCSRWYHARA
jgi:hypothetical protein